MISIPNSKSILQKIAEFRIQYIKDHNKVPDVIWLNPDERKDLKIALKIIGPWQHPVYISKMLMKNEEDRASE